MAYQLEIEGFEGQLIEVKTASVFTGPKILINGEAAKKGPKRGQIIPRKNDGTEVAAAWQPIMMGLDVPKLVLEGKIINVVRPLQWYEWAWSGLPILLALIGGFLGALAGYLAFQINTKIFRSDLNKVMQYILTAGVSIGAGIVYFILAVLLTNFVG